LGVAGFGATSVLCALAPNVELLVAARGLQGVAGALLVPSSLAILTEVYRDPVQRGAAIGTWTAATSAAIAVGPPVGGVLIDQLSWRAIFAMNVPIVAAALVIALRHVPALEPAPGHSRRVDLPGALLCAGGLGGVVLGTIEQPEHGWGSPLVALPLAAGVALLAAFVVWERRAREPMLPLGLFGERTFSVANAATVSVYAGLGGAMFFLTLFLQQVGGYSATEGGLAGVPVTLMLIALSRRWGALAERIGPRVLMTAGPAVMAIGLSLFTLIDADAAYASQVLPGIALFGLGLSMTVAPLTTTVLSAVDDRHAGVASGVNNAMARVAGLLAIAGVGAVVAGRLGAPTFAAAATDDAVAAFHAGTWVCVALLVVGAITSFVGLRGGHRDGSSSRRPAPPSGTL
uniref:MFS transporter n=1 Tax=Paraconexibacter sp. TaxID=2949640 RepID=UPI0035649C88